jgi:excisionase family DNA binding protein
LTDNPIAYRIPDAAKLTGTSRSTIYRLIADKHITPCKVRGRVLILREDLEAFMRGRREEVAA